jgi:hypothetical protein
VEQRRSQAIFQEHDMLGDHLRRHAHRSGSTGEGAEIGRFHEDGHAGQPIQDRPLLIGSVSTILRFIAG